MAGSHIAKRDIALCFEIDIAQPRRNINPSRYRYLQPLYFKLTRCTWPVAANDVCRIMVFDAIIDIGIVPVRLDRLLLHHGCRIAGNNGSSDRIGNGGVRF